MIRIGLNRLFLFRGAEPEPNRYARIRTRTEPIKTSVGSALRSPHTDPEGTPLYRKQGLPPKRQTSQQTNKQTNERAKQTRLQSMTALNSILFIRAVVATSPVTSKNWLGKTRFQPPRFPLRQIADRARRSHGEGALLPTQKLHDQR